MQSNSERMAGCVVAVNHNHLKQMIARSLEFGVHIREAYKPLNLRKTSLMTLIAICLLDWYGNTVKQNFDVAMHE